ncbi:MAG TPA: GNAT family N-acetyltransferase [Vicinamibacterales bacterium]|nr:GNAT family N-acetyltransferase [Vicinamibacterales bacterium]
MLIRTIEAADAADWARMRQTLWPAAHGEHAREIAAFVEGDRRDPAEVLVAVDDEGRKVGFAEVTLRSHAEGCRPGRVAYLEGWFVDAPHRRCGVGAALMAAVEAWGRAQGCSELASDTEIENAGSAAAHRALGFDEVVRIACFRKAL